MVTVSFDVRTRVTRFFIVVEYSGNMRPIDKKKNRYLNRRQWMAMMGIGGTAAVAGCLGDGDDGGDGSDGDDGSSDGGDGGSTPSDGDDGSSDGGDGGDDQGTESGGEDEGSSGEDVEELPEVSGSYVTSSATTFTTLNPLYNSEDGAGTAIGRALDAGYGFAPNGDRIPQHYKLNTEDGGKVWTFTLRDNLKFSDPYGQVTAEDYVYQITELHQSEWAATADASSWAAEVNVEQTGELEFQAELPNAQLLWPETFDPLLYPVPKALVEPYVLEENAEGLRQDEELLDLTFTGNLGAFTMDNWERSGGTTYTRNDEYYMREYTDMNKLFEKGPYFESSEIQIIEEQASRLGALEAGEIDAAGIPPERAQEFQNKDGVSVYVSPQPFNEVLSVNMRDNGWNAGPGNMFRYDKFRQAMAAAIDKSKIVDGVLRGFATPHYTWQPQWSKWYPSDRSDEIPKFGTEIYGKEAAMSRAEEAFAESEYDYGFDGDTMVTPEGEQVTLTWYSGAGVDTRNKIAEVGAQELENNLGMTVNVELIDPTTYDQNYFRTPADGEPTEADALDMSWDSGVYNAGPRSVTANESWDMANVYGLNTYPRNPIPSEAFFDGPDAFFNAVGYYPGFDAAGIYEQARAATSRDELKSVLGDLFVNIAQEQPYVMLAFDDSISGYDPSIVGPTETYSTWPLSTWYRE
jgi:peptide/nickel transport system substrate-binding protein